MKLWILGDSIIHRAAHRALLRPEGVSLGLERINVDVVWKGVRGAKLADFALILQDAIAGAGYRPDILVIHLGTNDFINTSLQSMFSLITNAIEVCRQHVPAGMIIWSDILTRLFFYQARDQLATRRCLRSINRFAKNKFIINGCYVIHYPHITCDNHDLFYYDCLHLSCLGSDVLINQIKAALETFIEYPNVVEFPYAQT